MSKRDKRVLARSAPVRAELKHSKTKDNAGDSPSGSCETISGVG